MLINWSIIQGMSDTTPTSGPTTMPTTTRARPGPTGHPRATLAATIVGSSVAFIDGSVVNVALDSLGRDLDASPASLAWAINAYLLPLGALTLLGGALGDRAGRRRCFVVGLVLFTVASLACALAPSFAWLLAGRVAQGVAAALLLPNSLAILGVSFSDAARGRAIGTWAAVGALAGALGPLIGGWLVDTVSWRAIFLLNLPLGIVGTALALKYVDESSDRTPGASLDAWGAVLATGGLCALTWALTAASSAQHWSAEVWIAGIAGVVVLAAFVFVERAQGDAALMPAAMFVTTTFIGLTLLTFFLYASLGGLIVALPYLLVRVGDGGATSAGAAMLPLPLVIGFGSRYVGAIAPRFGTRALLTVGATVVAVGLALFVRIDANALRYWTDIFPAMLVTSTGMAICVAPLTTAVMASVSSDHVGAASGFNSAIARVAGLVATALLGMLFVAPTRDALVASFHAAAWVGAGSALLAAISAFLLIRSTPSQPHPRSASG